MKIVKPGKISQDMTYKVTCQNCKAVVIFEHNEGYFSSDQRDGNAIVFDCPCCKRQIWKNVNTYQGPG